MRQSQQAAGRWEPIRELPPSAKLVAKVLDQHGRLTPAQLSAETLLPSRTVRDAVDRLDAVGAIDRQIVFTDARKRSYSLRL
jgi:DNA-binding MarR family transcriptional regulator